MSFPFKIVLSKAITLNPAWNRNPSKEFIVYAENDVQALQRFEEMVPGQEVVEVVPDDYEPPKPNGAG